MELRQLRAVLFDMDDDLAGVEAGPGAAEVGLQAGRAAGAQTAALKNLDGDTRLSDLHQLAALLQAGE